MVAVVYFLLVLVLYVSVVLFIQRRVNERDNVKFFQKMKERIATLPLDDD